MSKKVPQGITHEPKTMAWAEITPLSEHKKRASEGIKAEVIPTPTPRYPKEALPLSRATTDLRKAYPYIFDCAAYAKTHNPDKIETDEFYSRLTMPYHVFLDYCLDGCTEQTDYLKNEIYKLMKGQPAKYIKVSPERTVYAQPVVIAFSHTELKSKKDKRITNIKQDAKVDRVQVLILNELLDVSTGWLNIPKAFYAKIRHGYYAMQDNKDFSSAELEELEQGGFYKVYLALEYITANKSRLVESQKYDLLKMCEKCAPDYVELKGDKSFKFHDKTQAIRYLNMIARLVNSFPEETRKIIGIKDITSVGSDGKFTVNFFSKPFSIKPAEDPK